MKNYIWRYGGTSPNSLGVWLIGIPTSEQLPNRLIYTHTGIRDFDNNHGIGKHHFPEFKARLIMDALNNDDTLCYPSCLSEARDI